MSLPRTTRSLAAYRPLAPGSQGDFAKHASGPSGARPLASFVSVALELPAQAVAHAEAAAAADAQRHALRAEDETGEPRGDRQRDVEARAAITQADPARERRADGAEQRDRVQRPAQRRHGEAGHHARPAADGEDRERGRRRLVEAERERGV